MTVVVRQGKNIFLGTVPLPLRIYRALTSDGNEMIQNLTAFPAIF
jgi:hypothetical protein